MIVTGVVGGTTVITIGAAEENRTSTSALWNATIVIAIVLATGNNAIALALVLTTSKVEAEKATGGTVEMASRGNGHGDDQ